jgi:hypothetical protein
MPEHEGMVGQLPLEQHIGVRIPGGQPIDSKRLVGNLFEPNLGYCGNLCGNSLLLRASALAGVRRSLLCEVQPSQWVLRNPHVALQAETQPLPRG